MKKEVKKVRFNPKKRSLTIVYQDGSMKGYIGKIAVKMFNKLKS